MANSRKASKRPVSDGGGTAASSRKPGKVVDEVVLEIDYKIIEHFSKHLYGSPNRAIEELVTNGFDAFAHEVRVWVPGPKSPASVIVWDDGDSMDIGGLKGLWHIAASPKLDLGRVARGPRGAERAMIGKFGIGKLASYQVGGTIAHLCRHRDRYLLVRVDFAVITKSGSGAGGNRVRTPILELTRDEAEAFVRGHLATEPAVIRSCLAKPTWTMAIVGDLRPIERAGDLSPGMLSWILGNGMPLRPDFRVFVDDVAVVSKLARDDALDEWDFGDKRLKDALNREWNDAKSSAEVTGSVSFGAAAGVDPARPLEKVSYVDLPKLGRIHGTVRLFERSLEAGRSAEQGRSSGFFVMVRGRLVNPNDDKLFLHEPSFGTFYRSQYVLHIDGLDEDLLADRERLREGTQRSVEMRVLQRALYLLTRAAQTSRDEEKAASESTGSRLPTQSREHFRDPILSYLSREHPELLPKFNLLSPSVSRAPLGVDGPMADLSQDGTGFVINVQHPYYRSAESAFGQGRSATEFMRRYELVAIAERLLEGRLYDLGVRPEKVREIVRWRDGLFRTLAKSSHQSLFQIGEDLERASYSGGPQFERAITAVLRAMGFNAAEDGAAGVKDGLLVAPCGRATYTISFEAKGSASKVANDEAEVGGAASHRDEAGAQHAIVVAREFAGFERTGKSEPAILRECKAVGRVSIIQTAELLALANAIRRFGYGLDTVKDVFLAIESPAAKRSRIEALARPQSGFDWRTFLDAVWKRQSGQAQGDVVAYRAIKQEHEGWKKIPDDQFELLMSVLPALAPGLVSVNTEREQIHLLQKPEIVVQSIVTNFDRLESE